MKNSIKHWLSFMLLVVLIAGLIPSTAETIKTKTISLNMKGTVKLNIGATLQINATLNPANSTQGVKWSSSKKGIATVSPSGLITGKKAGITTITAKSGKRKTTIKVKVVDPYLPSSVKLDKNGTVSLPIGSTLTLSPSLSPATAKSGFTWKSSSKKIATVKNGIVTAKKVGTTVITVTTRNKKKAKVKIKVYDPYLPTSVKLNATGTINLPIGEELTLTPALNPATARSNFKWKSSKKKVATVKNGMVKAKKVGTTTITVTTRNKKKAKVKVKVYKPKPTPNPVAKPTPTAMPTPLADVIPVSSTYKQSYVIYVSKYSRTIAIIGKDSNGQFTKCLRKFSIGVGKGGSVRAGTFEVYKKERWRSWSYNQYSPYSTRIGPAYIHGPMYYSKDPYSMVPGSYNEIGTECSAGCLRTTCAAAAWIYYNCPVGTACIIANDSRFSVSRPEAIPDSQNWDPTDGNATEGIHVTGITISPNPVRVKPNETVKLSLILSPEGTTTTKFFYESTDKSIATVDSEGQVTGIRNGKCAIRITAADVNGYSTKVGVEVIDTNSTPTPTPTPIPTPTPVPDPAVMEAQTYLAILYPLDNVSIDGRNTDAVKAEIAKFQKEYNADHMYDEGFTPLPEDGALDNATKTALKQEAYREVLDLVPANSEGIEGFDTFTDEQKAELAIKQFQEAYNKEHTETEQQLNTEGKLDQDDNKTVNQLVAKAQVAEIQAMLNALGKLDAYTKGTLDEATVDAIKAFQTENGIETTGALDDATKAAIKKAYEDAVAQGIIAAASFDEDNLFAMEVPEELELEASGLSIEPPVDIPAETEIIFLDEDAEDNAIVDSVAEVNGLTIITEEPCEESFEIESDGEPPDTAAPEPPDEGPESPMEGFDHEE